MLIKIACFANVTPNSINDEPPARIGASFCVCVFNTMRVDGARDGAVARLIVNAAAGCFFLFLPSLHCLISPSRGSGVMGVIGRDCGRWCGSGFPLHRTSWLHQEPLPRDAFFVSPFAFCLSSFLFSFRHRVARIHEAAAKTQCVNSSTAKQI